MSLYRVMRNGSKCLKRGDIITGDRFTEAEIDVLVKVGAISEVSPPPISEIQGWKKRSEKLEKIGVMTVGQFLEADIAELAKAVRVTQATVLRWQQEFKEELQPPPLDGCDGCRN